MDTRYSRQAISRKLLARFTPWENHYLLDSILHEITVNKFKSYISQKCQFKNIALSICLLVNSSVCGHDTLMTLWLEVKLDWPWDCPPPCPGLGYGHTCHLGWSHCEAGSGRDCWCSQRSHPTQTRHNYRLQLIIVHHCTKQPTQTQPECVNLKPTCAAPAIFSIMTILTGFTKWLLYKKTVQLCRKLPTCIVEIYRVHVVSINCCHVC